MKKFNFEDPETKKKFLKYILITAIVSLSARYIPVAILNTTEILKIGSTAAITFALLDMYSPSINI